MTILKSIFTPPNRIDFRIEDAIGAQLKKKLIVHGVELPAYRFVDLFNATVSRINKREGLSSIETQQIETLNQLIHDSPPQWTDRSIRPSIKIAWQVEPHKEIYLPVDCFWLCPSREISDCFVIRLKYDEISQKAKLEVACGDTNAGEDTLQKLIERSRANSIYRNYVLQLS